MSPSELSPSRINLDPIQQLRIAEAHDDVIRLATAGIAEEPGYWPLYFLRGEAFMKSGNHAAAIPDFRQVLTIKESEPRALLALGKCLLATGQTEESIPCLAESFYTDPNVKSGTLLLRAAFNVAETDQDLLNLVLRVALPAYFSKNESYEVALSPYISLEKWCATHELPLDEFDAGGTFQLADTKGNPIPAYHAKPFKIATIPDASTIAGLDWLIAPTGEFLDFDDFSFGKFGDATLGYQFPIPFVADPPRNRVLHVRTNDEIVVDEDAVFLSAPPQYHFGDWLIDYLPRLTAWKRPGAPKRKIFTYATLPVPHRETLARFGIEPPDLIEGEIGKTYRFRSLSVPVAAHSAFPIPAVTQFLHSAMATQSTPLPHSVRGQRYFLERSQNLRGRNIVNSEELSKVLDEFGIITIRRPEFTVAEQDKMFSEARIIVSAFGTDVLSFFQLRRGSDIVVLEFEDMNAIYGGVEQSVARYCAILGMNLHSVPCGAVPRPGFRAHKADLIVDCEALRRTLHKLVQPT